ncbi:hypothetical protein ACF0H5_023780 [Mactra antiquata]
MAMLRGTVFAYILLLTFAYVWSAAVEDDSWKLMNGLMERFERLEASDAAHKAKIVEMEETHAQEVLTLTKKMNEMEANFERKVAALEEEIKDLKNGPSETLNDVLEQPDNEQKNEEAESFRDATNRIKRHENSIRKYRDFPENEVAFYATHKDHDIHHLGAQQPLLFQQTITNVGNAYNNNTGAFVAPVSGTYILHATIMGIDVGSGYYHAHFDVNGVTYSRFYVTAYDQSSQMLVIDLTAGQTVTVKNDVVDSGFVGQHYSTFSGFLLYQHSLPGNVIG